MAEQAACGHCGQEATKRCASCRNMRYCSAECQQADWPIHKLLCKSFADFTERPGEDYRRAILLPEDDDTPRFIWLPVKALPDKYGQAYGMTSIGCGFDDEFGVPEKDENAQASLPAENNPLGKWEVDTRTMLMICGRFNRGELLDHTVFLMAPRSPAKNRINICLQRFAAKSGTTVNTLYSRGPLILLGMNKVKLPKFTVDLDNNDLTLALDAALFARPAGEVAQQLRKLKGIKAHFTEPPTFEEIEVPPRHPVLKSGVTSAMAELMGYRMRTWLYTTGTDTKSPPTANADTADPEPLDAKVLRTCTDTSSPDFGRVPVAVADDKRSMLIVPLPGGKYDVDMSMSQFENALRFIQDGAARLRDEGGTPEERIRGMVMARGTAPSMIERGGVMMMF